MKIIEVPIFNDDGSVQTVQIYSAEEAKTLLQFAANFMMGIGNNVIANSKPPQEPVKFDD